MSLLELLKTNLTSEDMYVLDECEFCFKAGDDSYDDEEEYENFIALDKKCKELDLEFKEVETVGGEGQGDHYHVVFSVTHSGQTKLFRLNGWYASFNGYEFHDMMDFYEVERQPKTIYVYERPGSVKNEK